MNMIKVILVLGALALAITAGCATGQQNSQPNTVASQSSGEPGAQAPEEDVDPNEGYKDPKTGKIVTKDGRVLVCKNETPTGSNLPRKVCRWEADRDAQTLKEQNDMRDVMRRSSVLTEGGK